MWTFLTSVHFPFIIQSSFLSLGFRLTNVRLTFSLGKLVLVVLLDELQWRHFLLCIDGGVIVLVCQDLDDCFLLWLLF